MLTLRIALRYLLARKSHQAVNVISMISMAGVAVATMAMVAVLSVFNGFSDIALARLSLLDPELRVAPAGGKTIADADSLAAALAAIDGVAAAAPVVEEQALAIYHRRQMPVRIKGIPPGYTAIAALRDALIDGTTIDDAADDAAPAPTPALIGVGVAMQLGARPAFFDPLVLCVPRRRGRYNPAVAAASFVSDTTRVAGVFEIDQPEYDADVVYLPLDAARRLLDYTTEAGAVHLALRPCADPAAVGRAVKEAVGPAYSVATRSQQQQQAFRMINIEKWVTLLMLAFILVIAAFNIVSTLSMLIIEKTGAVALLRALGASAATVRRVFMLQGWLVTLVGGAVGILVGAVAVLAQQWGHFIKLAGNASTLTIDAYPVRLAAADLAATAAIVAAIGLAAGALAARMVPVGAPRRP